MDLADRLSDLATRLATTREHVETEEATKNAFVMPFISALGYDVFNPTEVVPEFTADVGTKKGEKVDYAIQRDGQIAILIEVKPIDVPLADNHQAQLFRYFSVTEARFAILTNGRLYRFYSDLDSPNVMDGSPFFEFDLADFEQRHIEELKKFRKEAFSIDGILENAALLKYSNAVKRILEEELENPSEDFVRFFASRIHEGRLTQAVLDQFTQIVRDARKQFINERINERLKSALTVGDTPSGFATDSASSSVVPALDAEDESEVETTAEEKEGYEIVRAICREVVDVNRIAMRDTQSYCGILLDDNNRKPICRLRFNAAKVKYVGVFENKEERRVLIESLEDIFKLAEDLKTTIKGYDSAESA